ncbi:hypothetical protein EDD18DRAFT_1070322 [Armillaria luteobubalina]|uniref:Uncharacterized protein n=1 Tax=Armillaria luteobubalina TaxID=153913 RepID=A0AA39QA65_9AGAR|nr:hypothetical protein EDD18DRAFT_1070322 [Armillaria luteobubalina]
MLPGFSGLEEACLYPASIIELHAFRIELLGTFEFSLNDNEEIRRESTSIMTLTVEGQVEKGSQLHLKVKLGARDE